MKYLFKDVAICAKFQFEFEMCSNWVYQKIGENLIQCISTPRTEKHCLGKVEDITGQFITSGLVVLIK